MSALAETGAELGSLSERLARARKARIAKKGSIVTLTVPGTDGELAASYRRLEYEERVDIAARHGISVTDDLENGGVQVASSADMLLAACTDLLEVTGTDDNGKPCYRSLGMKWNAPAVRQLFLIELPEKATARYALMEALDHEDLMVHFGQYMREIDALTAEDPKDRPGESEPSVEG